MMQEMYNGAFGTHLPMLVSCLALVPGGDVLELGSGCWSTLTLDSMCRAQGRRLVTVDTDKAWLSRFENMRSDKHELISVSDWPSWAGMDQDWGVVLVDQYPSHERGPSILRLAQRAKLIVAHDTETTDNGYRYDGVFAQFKYRYEDKRVTPHATVVSNSVPLPWV